MISAAPKSFAMMPTLIAKALDAITVDEARFGPAYGHEPEPAATPECTCPEDCRLDHDN